MKLVAKALLLLVALVASAITYPQTIPAQSFKHIIIIVQGNRTPDNMFGSGPSSTGTGCGVEDPFEPGVDIENGGYGYVPITTTLRQRELICNAPLSLNDAPLDPFHTNVAWNNDYHNGNMDGFCWEYNTPTANPPCPSYSFVQRSDVQPYFDLATGYGFANYMFETNEGPSFEAHQFLFTGTSAPVAPKDPNNYYIDFVAENANFTDSGCPVTGSAWPNWVQPTGIQEQDPRTTPSECYTHDSLVTSASGDKGFSWRYYTPTLGIIWDAPAAIPEVCYGQNKDVGGPCNAAEFTTHIALPNQNLYDSAPILDDIANCKLQKISWVIPDRVWSDHPDYDGSVNPPYGPSWVGNIVNAIGKSYENSDGACDYWGYPTHSGSTPEPTAIFVVWDDWGGFFDHVLPPEALEQNPLGGYTNCNPTSQWGCGYVYGFRVPFLVGSEYTQAAYVSGACTANCPNKTAIYQHDFGSILSFTEYNFGMPEIAPPYYADANTLDSANNNIPLSDFFSVSNQRNFTNINNLPYGPNFFRTFYATSQNGVYPVPTGPDGTSGEEE
jgi:phospholipase C